MYFHIEERRITYMYQIKSLNIKMISKLVTKPLNDDDILYTALWQTCAKYNHCNVLILPLHIYKETNPCIQGYQKSYKKDY